MVLGLELLSDIKASLGVNGHELARFFTIMGSHQITIILNLSKLDWVWHGEIRPDMCLAQLVS